MKSVGAFSMSPDQANSSKDGISCESVGPDCGSSRSPGINPELREWRRIRLGQDYALAESLRIDLEKDLVKTSQLLRDQVM